jgi:DNA-binding NarL/FixJ family response regulator
MVKQEQASSGVITDAPVSVVTSPTTGLFAGSPDIQLSRREREVALLIAQGLANRQIGAILAIKERTVEDHVSRLLRKLGLANRAQVILWSIRSGLVAASALAPLGAQPIGESAS